MTQLDIAKLIDRFNKQECGGLEVLGRYATENYGSYLEALKVKVLKVKGLDIKVKIEQFDNTQVDLCIYVNGWSVIKIEEVKEVYVW